MRLLCPNCSRAMTIPDVQSGQSITCEFCSHVFSAPEIYAPAVEMAPPTPISKPEVLQTSTVTEPTVEPAVPSSPTVVPMVQVQEKAATTVTEKEKLIAVFEPAKGMETPITLPPMQPLPKDEALNRLKFLGVRIPVKHIDFVGPLCLIFSFLFLFFVWVDIQPGGRTAYSQTGWQTIFAEFSYDDLSEQAMELRDKLNDPGLRPVKTSWWTVIHLLALLIVIPLAWGDVLLPRIADKLPKLPTPSPRLRLGILAGLSFLLFALLLVQYSAGFGLHGAALRLAEYKHRDEMKKAIETKRPLEVRKVEILIATDTEALRVRHSFILKLDLVVICIAAIAFALRYLTFDRGDRPDPQIGIYW